MSAMKFFATTSAPQVDEIFMCRVPTPSRDRWVPKKSRGRARVEEVYRQKLMSSQPSQAYVKLELDMDRVGKELF